MHSTTGKTVAIIGAGPYGLAIAAHLRSAGVDFRIFGTPMQRWRSQMPSSMLLKSEGCASSLPDPAGRFSLLRYCRDNDLPFSAYGAPVSREIFTRYALAFQQHLVPEVEDVFVTSVRQSRGGFELRIANAETLQATEVIVATGLQHMAYIPEQLGRLPAELLSHSADHYDLGKFKGKHVVVVGGGQAGLETAAILSEAGASPTLAIRAPEIAWNRVPSTARRPLYQRLRRPRTRLGEGLQLWVYDTAPLLFHSLPRQLRLSSVKAALGPAGAWWLKDRVIGRTAILPGHQIMTAEPQGGRVALQIVKPGGRPETLIADHVIAATGYRFDIRQLPFFDTGLKSRIRHDEQHPQLSANFESSVPGLYFTGLASTNSFGPAMRFIAGTSFTASRISLHLAKNRRLSATSFAPPEKCLE